MPSHKYFKSLQDLCVANVVENLETVGQQCWSAAGHFSNNQQLTSNPFDMIRNHYIYYNNIIYFKTSECHLSKMLSFSTASPILDNIFNAAIKKSPRIKTKHLKLLVTKQLESMNLSHLSGKDDVVFQLLCLAADRQVVCRTCSNLKIVLMCIFHLKLCEFFNYRT